ncbi:cytochrome c biogenesis protein ResB [Jatrophihabitans sp.]|uniref:cytochrome c biogenesis protein ResB n=1 Tax=Jatrophihabitans sp. TaxID=1932789 RepID=UPI0030C66BB2|nr:cytochrome biosis protein ResB [Jatrophihabitans sp.]
MGTIWRPIRQTWRRLTSMRTALILLFLLAVAAVPGSLLPQRPLNPDKTTSYIKTHGALGHFLNRIGAFDVFGSVWFAAIYLLLFISLVGCLIPRIRLHFKAVARKPLPAPRHLNKLPESGSFVTAVTPAEYATVARRTLGRRWRVVTRTEESGAVTLSAEKGYSRETGNLLFHVALLVALVLILIGHLYAYQGTRIILQGADQGFCNTVSQYDNWQPGRFAAEGKISPAPFCVDEMSKFIATYTSEGEASQFQANIVYRRTVDSAPEKGVITVNHPLRLEGDRVYLIGHGFAPEVTITMPDGSVRHDVEAFVPEDATTFLSDGAFKQAGPAGANKDVGVSGFFAPTPQTTGNVVTSIAPQANHPILGINVYEGDLNYQGLPQSVYSLDTSKMKELGQANLAVGETRSFKNGVSVRFDGWVPWASLQVSHDPSQGYLLFAALAMVLGLLGSLGVRRRRLWLRLTPSSDTTGPSPTVVAVGGLARSDSGNFSSEFSALIERLEAAGQPAGIVPVKE